MPLRPQIQFRLAIASILLAVTAETAWLWTLSSRPALQTPPVKTAASAPRSSFAETPAATPAMPLFVAPGVENAPAEPLFSPNAPVSQPANPPAASPGAPLPVAPLPAAPLPAAPLPAAPLPGDNRNRAKTLFDAATAAMGRKDTRAALDDFRRVVQIAPDHLPTRLNLALLYLQTKQPAAALPHLQKATQIAPKLPGPQFELARTYLALNQTAKALEPLRQAVRLAPKERQARMLLAQVYLSQKRPQEAYEQWTILAQSEPRDVGAELQAAAFAADVLKRPAEAEKWLRRAQSHAGRDPRPALFLGRILMAKNDAKGAAKVLGSAAKNWPDVFEIYPLLANARLAANDLRGAQGAIETALLRLPKATNAQQQAQIGPIEGGLRLTLGRILGQLKKNADAKREFSRAATLLPRDPEPQSLLAVASAQSGDRKSAVAALQKALSLDAKRTGDHLFLAQLQAQNKNWKTASEHYEAYTRLQPRDARAFLQWAQVASRAKNHEQELQIWSKMAALEPKNPFPLLQRGALLRDLKRPAESLATFQQALKRGPKNPSAIYEIARLETSLQQNPKATQSWKNLIALEPDFVPAYPELLKMSARSGNASSARLFLARQLSKPASNPKVLGAVLDYYEKNRQKGQALALLEDIVKRNPQARSAKAALDSLAPTPTNASPTNASPTNASPTNAPPTNASPAPEMTGISPTATP